MVDTVLIGDGISVGKALRDARKAAGLTQEEVARALNYSRATIAFWESGKREPTVAGFLRVMRVCGSSLDSVLEEQAASDVKLNELLSLWEKLSVEQRMDVLTAARRAYYQ